MAIVTVKNRYPDKPFEGCYDGKSIVVADKPVLLEEYTARHIKKQSIIRDNPIDPSLNEYRLYIVEDDGEQAPVFADLPIESLDRSDMEFPKVKYIQGKRPAAPPEKREQTAVVTTPVDKG